MKLRKLGHALQTGTHSLSSTLGLIAGGVIVLTVALTFADVFGRYALNNPISGAMDATELMLVCMVFWGGAYTVLARGHVRVDVVVSRFSRHTQAILSSATTFISLVIGVLISWQLFRRAWFLLLHPEIRTDVLRWPVAPFMYIAATGVLLLCLELVVDLFHHLGEATSSKWRQ